MAFLRNAANNTATRGWAGPRIPGSAIPKKELIGNYGNSGQEWQPEGQPVDVDVHDFPDPDTPKAVPRGVYDQQRNEGWVTVGCSHDTASFAVESIRRWWGEMGHPLYAKAGGSWFVLIVGAVMAIGFGSGRWSCSVGRTRRGWT